MESENKSVGKCHVPETSSTMLRDLAGGADSARWTEFVDIYTPVLVYWLNCLRNGPLPSLAPDMFDDIIQETMVSLMKLFPQQSYDRGKARFRTLLWTILRRRAMDFLSDSDRDILRFMPEGSIGDLQDRGLLDAPDPAEDDASRQLRDDLWRLIVDRVFAESNFSGRSKAIFTRHVAGESLTDLAREFGMDRNAAYQLKNRIMNKLTEKAHALRRESGDIIDMICALEREQGEKSNGK